MHPSTPGTLYTPTLFIYLLGTLKHLIEYILLVYLFNFFPKT